MVAMSKESFEAIQDLNAEINVKGKYPKAYAEHRGFWFILSDPALPLSESYLGSAICKDDAWRNAWHNVKEYQRKSPLNFVSDQALDALYRAGGARAVRIAIDNIIIDASTRPAE